MNHFYELRERLRQWFGRRRIKNARLRRLLLGGLFFALLTLILAGQTAPTRLDVKPTDIAPEDLKAPYDFENKLATAERRRQVSLRVPLAYKRDEEVLTRAEAAINHAFDRIPAIKALANQDLKSKVDTLRSDVRLSANLPTETYEALFALDDAQLSAGREDALRLAQLILRGSVRKEDVESKKAEIDSEQRNTILVRDPKLVSFIKELVKAQIKENVVADPDQTLKDQQKEAAAVEPVHWKKDQLILQKGQPVTEEQYQALEALGLTGTRANWSSFIGTALWSLLAISLVGLYLYRYRPDVYERDGKLILLGLIGLLTLLLCLLMKSFRESLGIGVSYLMPVAVNSMLVAILLDGKVALMQSTVLSLLVGIALLGTPDGIVAINMVVVGVIGSAVAVFGVPKVESRTDIYRAGLFVSGVNALAIAALYLLQPRLQVQIESVWLNLGLGLGNGLITAVLVTGALPLFENLFGVVTPLRLLELSNPNHPLLKRLLVEAPGSYHHTILVANLCEAAAEAIGADPVLARVGAYYHDIGKTKRPYFFVENQMGGENPHDRLPPSLSAMIITSHVKDGVEMAKEAGLPREIIDFILEHHGTMLVSYFFHMANKSGQSEYVLEEDFRYDGPKPRSKETAICMLADGCEASVRAMRQKGPLTRDHIETQVRRVLDDRLRQGQLENCDLTLREMEIIAKTFVKVLGGVHHARIEYPPEALAARLPADGSQAPDPTQEAESHGNLDQQRAGESGPGPGAGGSDPAGGGGDTAPGGKPSGG